MAPIREVSVSVGGDSSSTKSTTIYVIMGTILVMTLTLLIMKLITYIGQKTRDPQRRMYVGSRARPSLGQQPPTIFVSPANLPPPPKYEAMAPPSYEEVVGVHYPTFQPPISRAIAVQPITQPITDAVAHSSNITNDVAPGTNVVQRANDVYAPTTVTIVSEERRPSVNLVSSR